VRNKNALFPIIFEKVDPAENAVVEMDIRTRMQKNNFI
jgi:hypothetical protein